MSADALSKDTLSKMAARLAENAEAIEAKRFAPSTSEVASRLIATEGADPSSATLLASMFMDRLQYPQNGGVPVVVDAGGRPALDAFGNPKSPADLLAEMRVAMPGMFASAKASTVNPGPNPPANETVTARAAREHREAIARRDRQAASGEPPNPWHPSTLSVTRQVLIASRDPERAARLKTEASAR